MNQTDRNVPDYIIRNNPLKAWVRALEAIKILADQPDANLPSLFSDLAAKHGDQPALLGDGTQLSYRGLAERSNRYARWALAQGVGVNDTVCLLMPNCPDYVAIWLGIIQTGCVVALINTNLTGDALVHCINAAASTRIIVADSLMPAISEVMARLLAGTRCWVHSDGVSREALRIDLEIEKYSGLPIDFSNRRKPAAQDKALLIYTSGTTGLPKAAKVTHARLVEWSYWFAGMMDAQASDRLYNCLPMYHSIGGVVAVGSMLVAGGSVLIRERFSVSRFWADVIDGECTIFQYIGELCRYLANSQPDPRETQHRLRLCCGNGMRGDVWEIFQARFRIPQILEFYAATEGNVSLYNCEGKPGAIGRVPAFLNHRFPIALIRCDPDSGEPLRDENGFCVRCAADEPGEAIGKILRTGESQFDGYTDAKASAAKVLQHVFADDDRWFRTGDLMHKDSSGYYYFVDRLGDTYRWKGENVSTAEVAGVVRRCPGVIEATVYGVAVAGHEGRAGMAAITTDEDFSLVTLQQHLAANLPEYARPLFVRICESIEITSTFKMKNDRLSREGYLAVTAPDTVWFYDAKGGVYVKCDEQLRELIGTGGLNRKRSVQQQ